MPMRNSPARAALLALVLAGAALAQSPADRAEWPKTDFARRTVELAEIQSGGPPKDGIPAIDRPRFVAPAAARPWLKPKEPVIVVRLGGERRAYPLQILMFHEIVNDELAGRPVAVTFCPLCNASIVFDRRVAGRTLDFGTTGRLRKSDLVMYDRQTESWWQQFNGTGIVGTYAGTRLAVVPSEIVAFEDFAAAYPGGKVLSRETGHSRPYGHNPYRGYDRIDQSPFLFSDPVDKRLPPMERVLSVAAGGKQRIYPFAVLEKAAVINAELAGVPYVVFVKPGTASPLDTERIADGRPIPAATAFDRRLDSRPLEFRAANGRFTDASGSEWNVFGEAIAGPLKGARLAPVESGVHFAFAWLAFNPAAEIVRGAQ
jgi:hypothetical protein